MIFIRDNGQEYSDHAVEFIDAGDFDDGDAEAILRGALKKDEELLGKMDKGGWWNGSLLPLENAVDFTPTWLKKSSGISEEAIEKLFVIFREKIQTRIGLIEKWGNMEMWGGEERRRKALEEVRHELAQLDELHKRRVGL